jgi:hypothetical protein
MTAITVDDLTTNEKEGSGVFDALMDTMDVRLSAEYKKGRIKGTDYSKVYLGMMESVMSQSLNFILNKQQSDKQADLIAQQTLNAVKEGAILDEQLLKLQADKALVVATTNNTISEGLNIVKQGTLIDAQIAKTDQDTAIGVAQEASIIQNTLKAVEETLLVEQQVLVAVQEVLFSIAKVEEMEQRAALTAQQVLKVMQDILNATIEGTVLINQAEKLEQEVLVEQQNVLNMVQQVLKSAAEVTMLTKQGEKIDEEILMMNYQRVSIAPIELALVTAKTALTVNQTATELAQELKIDAEKLLVDEQADLTDAQRLKVIKETELLNNDVLNEAITTAILEGQRDKLLAEIALLNQKVFTVEAQIADLVDGKTIFDSGTGATSGVVGDKIALYFAQKEGFERDAEQKVLKIISDTWNVRRSSQPDNTPGSSLNLLDDTSVGKFVQEAAAGIGLTLTPVAP